MSTNDYTKWKSQFYSPTDEQLPDTKYCVAPLFALPSLSIIFGMPGTLKTNLILDLVVDIASGKSWLPPMDQKTTGFKVVQSPVVWVDADSGIHALHRRFSAMLRAREIKRAPIYYSSFLNPPFVALRSESAQGIIEFIKKSEASLAVFDNLGTLSGAKDINQSEMSYVMSNFRYIAEQTLSACLLIHHIPKHANGRPTPIGHTSIESAVDLALHVQRDGDIVTVTPTKTRNSEIEPFSAMWTYEHKKGSTTGELYQARFFGVETEVDNKTAQIRKSIIDCFHSPNGNKPKPNQNQIVTACATKGVSKGRVLSELHWMIRHKSIVESTGNARNAKFYSLANKHKK